MTSEKYPELVSRFLKYVAVDTQSDETATTVPSSPKEVAFLADLAAELQAIGLENVRTMADGYVFAELASNVDDDSVPTIGFIAHVDTADFNGANVRHKLSKIMMVKQRFHWVTVAMNLTQMISQA